MRLLIIFMLTGCVTPYFEQERFKEEVTQCSRACGPRALKSYTSYYQECICKGSHDE
jgi:hypothetical protein